MRNNKTAYIQDSIEKLLKDDPSKSYSKEEIINYLSNTYKNMEVDIPLAKWKYQV